MIGVLVPRLTDVVLATIYEGIDAAASTAGYSSFVANTGDDLQVQRRAPTRCSHVALMG